MLACAPRLAGLPGYAGVDLTMLDHGMFAAARTGYDATVEDHHRVSRMYAKFDKQPYHTLRGGKIAGLVTAAPGDDDGGVVGAAIVWIVHVFPTDMNLVAYVEKVGVRGTL